MEFHSSTQRRHWLFTREVLRDINEETTLLAAEACNAGIPPESSRNFAVTRSSSAADVQQSSDDTAQSGEAAVSENGTGRGRKRPAAGVQPLLTVEEEGLIKSYYAKKIQETSGRHSPHEDLRRSDKVQATAVAYFSRFYLSNSVLEHDPRLLMLTCIFLASKTEEQITGIGLLAKATGLDELKILAKELPLLKGLNFHLAVFHPYRALRGLVDGAQSRANSVLKNVDPKAQKRKTTALYDGARAALDDVMVTDLPFLHPPSRLALAALLREGRRAEEPPFDVGAMLGEEFGSRKEWREVLEQAVKLSQEMDTFLPYQPEKDKLKAVNKKLKKCALWSEARDVGGAGGASERRKSKKIKKEA